jgi:peptide/nickel transport system ATP-binding protein
MSLDEPQASNFIAEILWSTLMNSLQATPPGVHSLQPAARRRKPVLDIAGLTIELPAGADRQYAVKDLSISIYPGATTCIVGESGSGKSLAALAVAQLLPNSAKVTAGTVMLNGRDLLQITNAEMRLVRGREIGMIFQEPLTALNPVMRIGRQIEEVLEVHRVGSKVERARRCLELITEVGLSDPSEIIQAYPHQISGGQRQRVIIAIALALDPLLLIADEPTTALDVTTQAQILETIAHLRRKRNMAVMFITHDFGVVSEIADRVIVMRQGECVEQGAADEVLRDPKHTYTKQLLAAVPTMVPPEQRCIANVDALVVKGLTKTFRERQFFSRRRIVEAVKNVSFTVRRGETLGLVGESGSGKSTVARCISRLVKPDEGSVSVGEYNFESLSLRQLRPHRHRVQMIFQDPFGSLDPRRTIGASICEGMIANGVSRRNARDKAAELLSLVGLEVIAIDRYPSEFSGGQRQRLGIARALALNPEILIADEAISALDVSTQFHVMQLLRAAQARLGMAILFVTHDLRVATQMCDRIAVMRKGQLVELKETKALLAAPEHEYTQNLLSAIPGATLTRGAATALCPC